MRLDTGERVKCIALPITPRFPSGFEVGTFDPVSLQNVNTVNVGSAYLVEFGLRAARHAETIAGPQAPFEIIERYGPTS